MATHTDYKYGEFEVDAECERCGKAFSYTQKLSSSVSDVAGNNIGPGAFGANLRDAREALEKRRRQILTNCQGIQIRKCPHCGYRQSWMRETLHAKRTAGWATLLTVIVVGLSGYLLVLWTNSPTGPVPFLEGLGGDSGALIMIFLLIVYIYLVFRVSHKLVSSLFRYKPKVQHAAKAPALRWTLIDRVG